MKDKVEEFCQNVLYIDSRGELEYAELIAKYCPIEIQITKLNVGDYLMEGGPVIERKEINDFAASIKDKRLWSQLRRLVKVQHPIILIHGKKSDLYSEMNYNSIIGAKAWLIAQGVTILQEEDKEDIGYTILKIFEHFGKLKVPNDKKFSQFIKGKKKNHSKIPNVTAPNHEGLMEMSKRCQ